VSAKTIFGIITTLIIILLTGLQAYSSDLFKEKKIQYNIENIYDSNTLTGNFKDISIVFKNNEGKIEKLKNSIFFDIKVENTGNVDIPKSDFESDITFSFIDSNIIKAVQVSSNNKSIKAKIKNENNVLKILPLLLNKGDYFSMRVLLDQRPDKTTSNLRIIGMSDEFSRISSNNGYSIADYFSIVLIIFSFIFLGRLASYLFHDGIKLNIFDGFLGFIVAYGSALLLSTYVPYPSKQFGIGSFIIFVAPAFLAYIFSYLMMLQQKEVRIPDSDDLEEKQDE